MTQANAEIPHLYTVVLAGGSGTRFWPASRRALPKQLLALGKAGGGSLIAETVSRVQPLCPTPRVLIATSTRLLDATRTALPQLAESSFLGEPLARNTAPCIAWATAVIARRDPNAIVMVLPSDHHIGEPERFRDVLRSAVESANSAITTVGIEPTRPDTGYGYIERGAAVKDSLFEVARFVEKPDRARAEEYLRGGKHLWNSGMFFFKAADLLAAVTRFAPEIAQGIEEIEAAAKLGAEAEVRATEAAFKAFPSISIDYAVMERASPLRVVPGSFGWSDLGSWESAWELAQKDAQGNSLSAQAVYVDARDNLVVDTRSNASGKVLALVGVEGLCVVQTDDALLVIPRDRSQDVRQVVEALEKSNRSEKL
ncbi:MAG: mannose-1-phosphate guanylyltransferase [Polyangiaceae bacterium]